jgi:hypothetical protein
MRSLTAVTSCIRCMDYSIVPATITHVHQLSRVMREADKREGELIGFTPRWLLRAAFRESLYARTALIGTDIAGMWGLKAPILSDTGQPWLVTASIIETRRFAFIREAKREVAAMLAIKPRLEDYVIADYQGAVRLLEVLGFRLDTPEPYGRRGVLFRRFRIEA